MSKTSEIPGYRSWTSMKTRCRSANRHNAHRYADRGITYCERWELFENFYADMGSRPDGHTLDRIDNSKGYSPDNCRWASPLVQTKNRTRRDRNGERHNMLTLIELSHSTPKRSYWRVRCDCGTEKVYDVSDVVRGHNKSCGCIQFSRPYDQSTGRFTKSD